MVVVPDFVAVFCAIIPPGNRLGALHGDRHRQHSIHINDQWRICFDWREGAALIASDGEADHVHMLVEYPPKVSVSALVNILKGTSSRMLRQARPDIARRYYKGILWSPSYFAASTGGATLETIKRYVEAQRSAPPPRPKGRGFRRGNLDDLRTPQRIGRKGGSERWLQFGSENASILY